MNGLVGDVDLSMTSSLPAPSWVVESGVAVDSDPTFSQVILRAKRLLAKFLVSRQVLLSDDAEALLSVDLGKALSRQLDRVVLYGGGPSGPIWIANHATTSGRRELSAIPRSPIGQKPGGYVRPAPFHLHSMLEGFLFHEGNVFGTLVGAICLFAVAFFLQKLDLKAQLPVGTALFWCHHVVKKPVSEDNWQLATQPDDLADACANRHCPTVTVS